MPQANFSKNRPKKALIGTFWKIFTKKISKSVISVPKAPFEKFLDCSAENGCHKIVPKGGHFGKTWQLELKGNRPATGSNVCLKNNAFKKFKILKFSFF